MSLRSDIKSNISKNSLIDHRGREIEADSVSDIDLDRLLNKAIKK